MKVLLGIAALGLCASFFAASPSVAQRIEICGPPPLPACEDRAPRYEERERPGRRVDEPRPIGSRCTCENDDGEDVVGRIAR